jgi:hypothetical protein
MIGVWKNCKKCATNSSTLISEYRFRIASKKDLKSHLKDSALSSYSSAAAEMIVCLGWLTPSSGANGIKRNYTSTTMIAGGKREEAPEGDAVTILGARPIHQRRS